MQYMYPQVLRIPRSSTVTPLGDSFDPLAPCPGLPLEKLVANDCRSDRPSVKSEGARVHARGPRLFSRELALCLLNPDGLRFSSARPWSLESSRYSPAGLTHHTWRRNVMPSIPHDGLRLPYRQPVPSFSLIRVLPTPGPKKAMLQMVLCLMPGRHVALGFFPPAGPCRAELHARGC